MKARLKDLGTIFTGNTPSKRVDEYWDNSDIKFIKPDIIKDELCVIYSANEYISAGAKNASRIVPANSVLVTCIGNIGRVGITEEEVAFNQQINAIVPNRTIIPKYLAYAIYANRKQLQAIANAPVVPIINKTQFSDFEISICESLEKQNKIVRILDTISEIITHNKKKIEALDNLIKARFVEMFGGIDRYISIKDSGLFIADGNYSSKYPRSSEFTSFGVPFIRANNIKDNTVVDDDMYFISPEKHDELKKGHLLHGDILVTTRGNIGQLGIVPQKHNNSNINAQIVLLRCRDTKYLPEYLLFALQTVDVKKQFIRQQTGTALKQLPVKHLEKISFIDAPVELQNQFATFVTQVDKSKFALQNNIISLMNLWYNINQYVCERTYGEA